MDFVLAAYVALVLIAVPIFRTEGVFGLAEAKDALFAALTGLMVVVGLTFHMKLSIVSNPWMLAFFGFAAISLLWCDHQHLGRREVVRLLAILAFVGMASNLPKDYLILACFLPAPVVSLYGIIQQVWRRDFCDPRFEGTLNKRTSFQTWFGNANYAGTYLTLQGFLGVWLTVNQSLWFGIPTTIVFLGIALSQCRAAQFSCMVGAALLFPWAIPIMIVLGVVAYLIRPGCLESIGHRRLMVRAAFEIWKKFPLFGAGPRCFRHKHSRATAELNLRDETILGRPGKPGRYQFFVGRRAHNDYMETLAEYGLIGTLLAGAMLTTFLWRLSADWILFAGAAAVMVNAAFFFAFRDTAISLPFWTVVATTGLGTQMPVGLAPALIGSALVLYLLWLYAYKPFMANWMEQRGNLLSALKLQPFATDYLYRVAEIAVKNNQPALAFNCAEKAVFLYDGERPEWMVLNTFGSICEMNGAIFIAKSVYEHALIINPRDKESFKALNRIKQTLNEWGKMKEAA